jgi:hypothetical protein
MKMLLALLTALSLSTVVGCVADPSDDDETTDPAPATGSEHDAPQVQPTVKPRMSVIRNVGG